MMAFCSKLRHAKPFLANCILSKSKSTVNETRPVVGTRKPVMNDLELAIFDKDGTLICIDSMWIPRMENQVKKLETATGVHLEKKLYKWWGFDKKREKFTDQSILAHYTSSVIIEKMVSHLSTEGFNKPHAQRLLSDCWEECDTKSVKNLRPLADIVSLFDSLCENGIKTAICTSDSREGTIPTLKELGILHKIDKIVCGNDLGTFPKPNPYNIWFICKELNVCPLKTLMVGDTTSDTQMSKSAGVGLTVGVLSGAGVQESLEKDAHVVLNHVGELLPFLKQTEE